MASQLQQQVEQVQFTLNGESILARADETILQAAQRQGIEIMM